MSKTKAKTKVLFGDEADWSSIDIMDDFFQRIYQREESPWGNEDWWHYSNEPWKLEEKEHNARVKASKLGDVFPYQYHIGLDLEGHFLFLP
jgi:hypothetical protein